MKHSFQLRRASSSSNLLRLFLFVTHVLCDSETAPNPAATPPSFPLANIDIRSGPHQQHKEKVPDLLQMGLDAVNLQLATTPKGLWFGGNVSSAATIRTTQDDSQCGDGRECEGGQCCSPGGKCGYKLEHCGPGCKSNCNAKAICGIDSADGQTRCPLNLCCSYYGWCGTEAVHCIDPEPQYGQTPCQQGMGKCEVIPPPQCGGDSASRGRKIGYYQAYQRDRKCNYVQPQDIYTEGMTHLFFSFAYFDPAEFGIKFAHQEDEAEAREFTKLQDTHPGLQTWVAFGGWAFNDPGEYQSAFSNMVSTQQNRKKFIDNLKMFLWAYRFTGIDIDWEYPGEEKRGGRPEDGKNLVEFVKEMRAALGTTKGISITLAPDWGYLKNFSPVEMQPYVDFMNFMGYDLHGQWDADVHALGSIVRPHSDITEIERNLRPLWYDGVDPGKINLGLAWYGRTYKLANPGCTEIGCPFKGPGAAGKCTAFEGVLSSSEITEMWWAKGLQQHLNSTAMVKYMVYDNDNWVGFDDIETHHMKEKFANSRCLGGLMYWSVDYDPRSKMSEGSTKFPNKEHGSGDLLGQYGDVCTTNRGWETKKCRPSTGDMDVSQDNKVVWTEAAAGGLWCETIERMKREFTPTGSLSKDFNANKESERIAALMGHKDPPNFSCGPDPQGGCAGSTECDGARTPAGAMILTSMSNVALVSGSGGMHLYERCC
jgi:chitinase